MRIDGPPNVALKLKLDTDVRGDAYEKRDVDGVFLMGATRKQALDPAVCLFCACVF